MRKTPLFLFTFLLIFGIVQAQTDTCPALVQQALTAVGDNCDTMDRNSACYGYDLVQASFTEATDDEDFFSQPADRAELALLNSVRTAALDLEDERWGVAVMNVQAALPNTLPGQGVVFLLLGDTEVTNGVSSDDVFNVPDPVAVTTNTNARLRSGPSTLANAIDVTDTGTVLQADGLNEAGDWVRVVYNDTPAWIFRNLVNTDADLDTLPAITEASRTPMQAFYFSTGIGSADCLEAPDTLLVQSPQNIQVNLTVNEAEIQFGSTGLLQTNEDGDGYSLTMIEGDALINDDVFVPAGFRAMIPLDPDAEPSVEGGGTPSGEGTPECDALSEAEVEQIESWLADAPQGLLNYPVESVETTGEVCSTQAERNAAGSSAPPPPPPAEDDPPAADATPSPTLDPDQPSPTPTEEGVLNCAPLQPRSPIGGTPPTQVNFSWTGIPEAELYRVIIFDQEMNVEYFQQTTGPETQLTIDLGEDGVVGGFEFFWLVDAITNAGETLCTSPRVDILRGAPVQIQPTLPVPPPVEGTEEVDDVPPPPQEPQVCQPEGGPPESVCYFWDEGSCSWQYDKACS